MRSEYQDPILMDHLDEEGQTGAVPSARRSKQPSHYFKHNVNTAESVENNDPLLHSPHMCDACVLNPDISDYVLCHTCPFNVDDTKTLKCPSGMNDVKIIRTSVGGKLGDAALSAALYNHCQDTMTDAVDFQCEFNLAELTGLQPETDAPVEEEFFAEDEFMMDPQKFMDEFMPGEPPLSPTVLQSTQAMYAEFFKACPPSPTGEKVPRHPKCWDANGEPSKPTVCDDGTPIERPHHGPPCAGDARPVCEDADGNTVLPACDAQGTQPVEVPPCEDGSTPTCEGDPVVCLNKQTQESTEWTQGERCPVGSRPKCETRGVKATCADGSYAKLHRKHHGKGKGKGADKGADKGKGKGSDTPVEEPVLSKAHATFVAYFKKCPKGEGKKPHPPACWNGDEPGRPTICSDGSAIQNQFPPCGEGAEPMCGTADAMTEMTCDPEGTEPEEISACEDNMPPTCDDGNPPVCEEEGEEAEALEQGDAHMCDTGKPPRCQDNSRPMCSDGTPPRHPHGKGKGKGKGQNQGKGQGQFPFGGQGQAPPAMNQFPMGQNGQAWGGQQPVGQNGHGIAPWAGQQQPVGQDGHGKGPWAGQQPVGQDGHGKGPWAGQQPVGQNGKGRPPMVNGMPPSDMNGVAMGPQMGYNQQMPTAVGQQSDWGQWFQQAVDPTEPRLSATQQRPGPGFGRHPWEETGPFDDQGPPPHRFHHHWDAWKKQHDGEVKVEFMCLK